MIAISNTWRISPLANASTSVLGMIASRKSVVLCILLGSVYEATAFMSIDFGSMFMPAPGATTLTMISPTISAIVLTTSK